MDKSTSLQGCDPPPPKLRTTSYSEKLCRTEALPPLRYFIKGGHNPRLQRRYTVSSLVASPGTQVTISNTDPRDTQRRFEGAIVGSKSARLLNEPNMHRDRPTREISTPFTVLRHHTYHCLF